MPYFSSMIEELSKKPENPYMQNVDRRLRNADRHFLRAIQILDEKAERALRKSHPVEAAVLKRISVLLGAPAKTMEEFSQNAELARKLMDWLPIADELKKLNGARKKAWKTLWIMKLKLKPTDQEQLIQQITERPGAPQTTRHFAICALELQLEGKPWHQVAKSLPCDWTMVENPGESIRRQVQFLRRVLQECGVRLEPSEQST